MNIKVMGMSQSDQWATPQDFFDKLDAEFHFTLDPCADDGNQKCDRYYTREQDGLTQDWGERQYSAIRHMGEKFPSGSKKLTRNRAKTTLSLSC